MEFLRWPAMNAALNVASAFLLILGYVFIRQNAMKAHVLCMVGAFLMSSIFLVSYLFYHYYHGSTGFAGQGWSRVVYFTLLISHSVLALAIVPMVLLTMWWGIKGQFEKHVRIARITFPIWLYVSVTGVLVYAMLYHMT
ncbi:MAG: DUF420 domain-containing protein [Candidatus Omnitrophota bacterium]|nr:DUF420 domain-containing protein [Candidatus Omnitrophota bacterium]